MSKCLVMVDDVNQCFRLNRPVSQSPLNQSNHSHVYFQADQKPISDGHLQPNGQLSARFGGAFNEQLLSYLCSTHQLCLNVTILTHPIW